MAYLKNKTNTASLNMIIHQYFKMIEFKPKHKVKLLLLVCFSMFAAIGHAQITEDAISSVGGTFTDSVTVSHTTGTGNHRIMVVGIGMKFNGIYTSGVTYNGISLTHLAEINGGDPGGGASTALSEFYYLIDPPVGTYDVVTSFPANNVGIVVGVVTYSGVDPINTFGPIAAEIGVSNESTLTVSSDINELVLDVFSMKDEIGVIGVNQTEEWSLMNGGGSTQPGATSVDMIWTGSGPLKDWAHIAVSLRPQPLTLTTSVTNNMCDNDIDLTILDGVAPYTYSWFTEDGSGLVTGDEDQTGLSAGTYSVTVTDAIGLESETLVTILVPGPVSLASNMTQTSSEGSNDGAIDLIVSGGVSPFSYSWSNGENTEDISGLSDGIYSVTVTDNCSSISTASITLKYFGVKNLYLTDLSQGLDRIDPADAGTTDNTNSSTAEIINIVNGSVSDDFNSGTFSGGTYTGPSNWSGDWIESDAGGTGPSIGDVRIWGSELTFFPNNIGANVYREIDLTAATAADLSFDLSVSALGNGDIVILEGSSDGGASYPWVFETYTDATPSGIRNYDLLSIMGVLGPNTRIRFRVTGTGASTSNNIRFDDLSIIYSKTGNPSETFTQGLPMCSDFTIKAGENITISTYASVTLGTIPSSPDITAIIEYGTAPTIIISLSNPIWDGSKITWTGTIPSNITIPAGQAISLTIISNEISGAFTINYDSQIAPSKIDLPASTVIDVESFSVYDAPFNGGNIITEEFTDKNVYLRAVVSDPFGIYDITGLEFTITDPNTGVTTVSGTEVSSVGCTKTYELAWEIPNIGGDYTLGAIAHEGTEGIFDKQLISFVGKIPATVTKTIVSPATGPYTINDNLVYNINIENVAADALTTVPLQDIFDNTCLEYVSASIAPDNIGLGTISWDHIGIVGAYSSTDITVTFKVIGNCDPARNIAKLEGVIYNSTTVISAEMDTVDINVDEAPIAEDDAYFISGPTNFQVLDNDVDLDNDMTTLSILGGGPISGTATVNGLSIDFNTSGMSEDQSVTFVYQICDNASPVPYCDDAQVTVVYSAINNVPVLVNDTENTTLNLDVIADILANDSDIDGNLDRSTLSISADPQFGTAEVNPDGTITYSPNLDYFGPDQLTYMVCDDGSPMPSECSTAVLDLTVVFVHYACKSSNSTLTVPPIAVADSYVWDLPVGAVIVSGAGTNEIVVDFSAVVAGAFEICAEPSNFCGPGMERCVEVIVTDIMIVTDAVDALCKGNDSGGVNLTISGGVSPYEFIWSNGSNVEDLMNVIAGSYSVTVTDKYGCSAIASETVSEPPTSVIITGAVVSNEDPYGSKNGSIDLSVSGGTPGYTFNWTDGFGNLVSTSEDPIGLAGGTYTVIVTDSNGCTDTNIYTVNTVGGPLWISAILATPVDCYGSATGSINLEVIGGSTNYTYDWDYDGTSDFDDPQDPINLTAGFYTVVVNDGTNPTVTMSVEIVQPISPLTASSVATNATCFGDDNGSIDASASGGTLPYRYEWNTGSVDEDISGLFIGTYTLTVTDAKGCTAITSKTIIEPSEIAITGVFTENKCGPTDSGAIDLTVTGGNSPYTVAWSNGATTQDITGLSDGLYSVIVTDNAGCVQTATFTINKACIGVSKALVGTPINNGDGSYAIVYNIAVENYGNVDLNSIQVMEELSTTFSAATSFTLDAASIVSQPSDPWTIQSNFDGDTGDGDATDATDDEILSPLGILLVGESAVIRLEVTVVPGSTLTYMNSAGATGTTNQGKTTDDISQNGNDADPDNDGDPTNNNDPTPVTLEENPQIGLAKVLGETITNNHDATYSLNFNLRVENTGDVILKDIQVTDDLQLTFPGLNLSNISGSIVKQPMNSVLVYNSNYDGLTAGDLSLLDGLGTLAVGEFAIININLTVEVDGSLGVFYNTASSVGTSPAGNDVNDVSQDGIEVDPDNDGNPGNNSDPTPVSLLENPIVKIDKTLFSQPINNGDGTFTIAYNLEINNQGDVPIKNLQVTDDLNAAYPGLFISNVSTSIITQPTTTTLVSNVNYDGTSSGNINLLGANGRLNVGELMIIRVSLKVALNNSLGPFVNGATATGNGPGGTPTSDFDDETLSLTENPSLGFAKTVDTPVNNQDASYTINYTIKVENTGDVTLNNVEVKDDLSATFAGSSFTVLNVTSPTLAINGSYDGYTSGDIDLLTGTDVFEVGETGEIVISLSVYPGTNLGPYDNSAFGTGTSHGGTDVMDISQDGNDVDPDNDGDPTNNNDPTPVSFLENPIVGVAKDIISDVVYNGNGTYSFTYEIRVENMGNAPLYNVQVVDDLATTYALATGFTVDGYSIAQQPASSTFTAASSYNGSTQINLLTGTSSLNVGDYGKIHIQLTVTPGLFGGPYNNTAIGYGTSPAGRTVYDLSQDGLYPDPDNDGIPTNNNVPTPVSFFLGNTTVAEDDINQTEKNTPVRGDLSTNDYDPEDDNQSAISIAYDSDGNGSYETSVPFGALSSVTSQISGYDRDGIFVANAGSITVNSDRTYLFTPFTDFTGTAYMRYDIMDDNFFPVTDNAILAIDVTGTNTNDLYPPIALDDNATTSPDVNVDIEILINDSDVDGYLVNSTIDLRTLEGGIQNDRTIPGQGTFTVNHTTGIITFDPLPDFIGSTTPFKYQVCDNDGLCDQATITVHIYTGVANIMTAEDDANSGFSGDVLTGNVLINDIDPDGSDGYPDVASALVDSDGDGIVDDILTLGSATTVYGESANSPGMYVIAGILTLNSDGTYNYDSDSLYEGIAYVPYQACDNDTYNACDRATLYLSTRRENGTVAEDDVNFTTVNIPVSGDVSINDWDAEGDNQTVISALSDTDGDGMIDDVLFVGNNTTVYGKDNLGVDVIAGTIILISDGTYDYNPSLDFVGTVELEYTITDDNGRPATDSAILVIDVTGPDGNNLYPPIALNDNAITEPDTNVEIPNLDNDSDVDGVIDPSSLDLDPSVPGIQSTYTVANEGVYTIIESTITAEIVVLFDPEPTFRGYTTPIDYLICDDDGLCDDALITVLISDPTINEMTAEDDANSEDCSGSTLTGEILSNDIDPDGSTGIPDVFSALVDSDGNGIVDNELIFDTPTIIYGRDYNNPGTFIIAGTITLSSNGNYIFDSEQSFEGSVYMPYTACDNDINNACDNATLYLTIVKENPIVQILGDANLCLGETTTLSPSTGGSWSGSNPAVAIVSNDGHVVSIGPGTVTFTFTDASDGCVSDATAEVTVNPELTVSIDYNDALCIQEGSQLAALPVGGSAPYTYNWEGPNGFNLTGESVGITDSGNYYLTVTDASGCTAQSSGYVNEQFDPFIFTLVTTVCEGDDVLLNVNSETAVAYQWDSNAGNAQTQSVTVFPSPPSTTYFVTVTNDIGCTSVATAMINVDEKTDVAITGDSEICIGETTQLLPTTGGTWVSTNSSLAGVSNTGLVTGLGAGSVTFIFTNSTTNCESNPTLPITINPKDQVSITGPSTICEGDTTSLSPSSGGTWQSSNNSVATVSNDGIVTAVGTGSATFTFTNSTTNCASDATSSITINTKPVIAITGASEICIGAQTFLTPTSGGVWESTNPEIASITNNGIVTAFSQGTAYFTYTSSFGCTSDVSEPITVGDNIEITLDGDPSICENESQTLTASVAGGNWSSSNPGIAYIDPNTGVVTGIATGNVVITYDNSGSGCYMESEMPLEIKTTPIAYISGPAAICTGEVTTLTASTNGTWSSSNTDVAIVANDGTAVGVGGGTVTFTFTANNGCSSIETNILTVHPDLDVSIDFGGSVCLTEDMQLTANVIGGSPNFQYSWTGPGGFASDQQIIDVIIDGNYELEVTDDAGCSTNTSAFVYGAYNPFIFALETEVCEGEDVTLSVNSNTTAQYQWSANAGGSNSQSVTVIPTSPSSTYIVTVTNNVGCSTVATAEITVFEIPVIEITGNLTICEGATTTLSPTTGGTWTSSDNNIATIANDGVVTGHNSGSATFTFTNTSTGCVSQESAAVTVGNNTVVDIIGIDQLCIGIPSNLTTSATGGTWGSSDTTIVKINTLGELNPIAAGNATITYTFSSNECYENGALEVAVNEVPTVNINGQSTICEGDNTYLIPSSNGSWSSSDESVATVTNNGVVTGISEGSATFTYTSSFGCTNTLSTPINIIGNPEVSFIGPSNICVNENSSVSPTTGGIWMSSNPNIATVNSQGIITGVNGGTVSLIFVEFVNGCIANEILYLTVNEKPTISAPEIDELCIGEFTTISPTEGGTWLSANPAIAQITNEGVITAISAGFTSFVFTDTSTGCISNASSPISVEGKPSIGLIGADAICPGSTTNITPSSGGIWTSTDESIATITNQGEITAINVGEVYFIFTSNTTGCPSDSSTLLTIDSLINTEITGDDRICVGETTTLFPDSGGSWESSDENIAAVTNTGVVTASQSGIVTFTFTSTESCSSQPTSDLIIDPKPNVTFIGASEICAGSTTQLSPTSGGIWTSSNTSVATITNGGIATGLSNGSAIFTFTNIATGCSANSVSALSVYSAPQISIDGVNEVCIGGFTNMLPSSGGTWVSNNPSIASITASGEVTGLSEGTATFTFTESGTGCTSSASAPITILAKPTVIISGENEICIAETTTLSPTIGGTWISSNNTVATVTNDGVVTAISEGTASFTFISNAGCASNETSPVIVLSAPTIYIDGDDILCIGANAQMSPSTGGTWQSTNNGVATISNTGFVTAISSGEVRFIFTNTSTGCSSEESDLITINESPVISTIGPDVICVGTTTNLTPTAGGVWESLNPEIATILNNGEVTGVAPGSATFVFTELATGCSSEGFEIVTVNPGPTITYTGDTELCIGEFSSITPNTGGSWTSTNPGIATITNAGIIEAISQGAVSFKFIESGTGCTSQQSSSLIVHGNPTTSVAGGSEICIGSTTNLLPDTGGTWTSNDPLIASVTANGEVTGLIEGIATFVFEDTTTGCTSDGNTTVTVGDEIPVSITGDSDICMGYTTTLSPTVGGNWVSSNPNIATVTNNGIVTGIAPGKVTFEFIDVSSGCTSGGVTDEISIQSCLSHDFNVSVVNHMITGNLNTNDNISGSATYGAPILISKPSGSIPSITINTDGTYEFEAALEGKYMYYIPVCIPPAVTGCPKSIFEINVVDNIYSVSNPVSNLEFATTYMSLDGSSAGDEININTIANDDCIFTGGCDLDATTVTIIDPPSNGSTSIDINGVISYIPDAGFIGQDTLEYQICVQGESKCSNSKQYLVVNHISALNSTVAADDFGFTMKGEDLSGNAMNNDTDPEGDIISVVPAGSLLAPISIIGGEYYIEANGDYTFIPNEDFTGSTEIIYTICDDNVESSCTDATVHILVLDYMLLNIRVYLEGAMMQNGGEYSTTSGLPLMRDNLRLSPFTGENYIPLEDPYTTSADIFIDATSQYNKIGPGLLDQYISISDSLSVMSVSGDNAIVDWVHIELRSKDDMTLPIATRSGLLQRDGDIVELDGVSSLALKGVNVDSFYVVIKHRSHLGAMSMKVRNSDLIDFTSTDFETFDFGTSKNNGADYTGIAQKSGVVNGYNVLWGGDFDSNGKVKFTNPSDDQNIMFIDVLFSSPGFLINYDNAYGYLTGDYNMDGKTKYTNPSDDLNYLFSQILLYPNNSSFLSNYNSMIEQIPE